MQIKARRRQHTAAVIFDLKEHACSLTALCALHGRKYVAALMCLGYDSFMLWHLMKGKLKASACNIL